MASQQKRVWLVLTIAFMMSIGVYCGLVLLLSKNQQAPSQPDAVGTIRTVVYAVTAVGLLGSLYWSQMRMPGANSPQRFQTEMIVALAFAEAPTIAGVLLFFIGRKTAEFWPFAILSLLIQALFVLPRVLQRS